MSKPSLKPEYEQLERDIIDTFLAGLHEWRPDLSYPESHSDMQGGVRALFRMFDIKRKPLATPIKEFISEHDIGCDCPNCQV